MPKRSFIYRGFTVVVYRNGILGWCAKWRELTGGTIHSTFDQGSEQEALDHAQGNIDAYHHKIDIAQYPKGGTK